MLKDIEVQGLIPAISNLRKRKLLKTVDSMSILLRVGDPRRLVDDDTLQKVSNTLIYNTISI